MRMILHTYAQNVANMYSSGSFDNTVLLKPFKSAMGMSF